MKLQVINKFNAQTVSGVRLIASATNAYPKQFEHLN